jgi:hypothetical protein
MFRPHVDLFAEVGAVVGEFCANTLPAAEVGRGALVDRRFDLLGQREELRHQGEVAIDERVVDAVVDQVEEPDLMADGGERVGKCSRVMAPVCERHLGNRREALGTHVASLRRSLPDRAAGDGETGAMEKRDWSDRSFDPSKGPIQVNVDTIEHLFNPIDPQPLNLRDLDVEIADWITNWAEEQHDQKVITIEVVVADDSANGREDQVTAGIHNHFAYRRWVASRQLSHLWRDGRISLMIGLVVLVVFTMLSRLVDADSTSAFTELIREGLLVAPWVAMWKPMEIFLYLWWPVRREKRVFDRLAAVPVTFKRSSAAGRA